MAQIRSAIAGASRTSLSSLAAIADSEGYGEVASLFRAAARVEEIHARNHAEVIKKLGSVPQTMIEPSEVNSTRENLQAAIKGDKYERDAMYPEFLKQARLNRNKDSVRSLNLANTAEADHARLYASALADLKHLRGSKNVTLFVCPTCGYTTRDTVSQCPSCFTSKEKFEQVA
jgi:rubrerythrin